MGARTLTDGNQTAVHVVRFQTTAEASADAHALVNPRWTAVDIVVDAVAFATGLVALANGYLIGIVFVAGALIALASTRFHPLQRAVISWRFRSLLGKSTEVTIGDAGLGFANEIASTFVPWTSIGIVCWNDRTVAFIRDRALVGYIPTAAFASSDERAEVIEFARGQVPATTSAQAGPRRLSR